jgi:hypothetical protein
MREPPMEAEGGHRVKSGMWCAFAAALLFAECDRLNPALSGGGGTSDNGIINDNGGVNSGLSVVFGLYDTTGRAASSFHAGESLDMSCVMTNTSRTDLAIQYPYPTIAFSILQNGVVIASSTDGYAFPMVVVRGTLKAGGTISGTWRGPNTQARIPKISLSPGTYTARVTIHVFFENASLKAPADIPFSVIP